MKKLTKTLLVVLAVCCLSVGTTACDFIDIDNPGFVNSGGSITEEQKYSVALPTGAGYTVTGATSVTEGET